MASVTGSRLAFFSPGLTGDQINVALTTDGSNLAAPVAGKFNIEVFTSAPAGLAAGYQAAVFVQGAQQLTNNVIQAATASSTEKLGAGTYEVIDQTGNQSITVVGGGSVATNVTVFGSGGDTITGSTVSTDSQLFDASGTNAEVSGGPETISAGAAQTTVWAGSSDSITGGSGAMTVAGNAKSGNTITGGSGSLFTYNFGNNNSVTGSSSGSTFIDDNYGGSVNTLVGGAGSTTIIAGPNDKITGGAGATLINAVNHGNNTVTGGSGNLTVWGGTNESITGGAGSLEVAGNAKSGETIKGGSGNLKAYNLGTGDSVTGSTAGTSFIDDSYGSGSHNTLTGGTGASTIISGSGDSIAGGTGTLEARFVTGLTGTETLNLSSAQSGVRDVSLGGAGSTVSVTGFASNSNNVVESATSVSGTTFLGTSSSSGGNTTLTFLDGTTMTLIGVASVSSIKFTQ